MYVLLFIVGNLFIIGAGVYKYFEDNRSSGDREEATETRHQELVDLIAEAHTLKSGYKNLLEDLKATGKIDPAMIEQLEHRQLAFKSAEERLGLAMREVPAAMVAEHQKQRQTLQTETAAEERAAVLDSTIRPKLRSAFETVQATVARAIKTGLVRVDRVSSAKIPVKTMFSAFQLKGKPRAQVEDAMTVQFSPEVSWKVYVEFGYVKSPAELAEWNEGQDLWYPMIRIEERRKEASRVLGTIYFEPSTTNVSVNPNDATPETKKQIEQLKNSFSGDEFVANAIIELLKETPVKSIGS